MIIIAGIAGIIVPIGRDLYLDGNALGINSLYWRNNCGNFAWIGCAISFSQIPDYNELEWRGGPG